MSYISEKIEFDDIEKMTKETAIKELRDYFKGHKKFIEYAILMINTTHGFKKINNMSIQIDSFNWEKFLGITIYAEIGFKQLFYRKGNVKYKNKDRLSEGNKTYDIDGFAGSIYYTDTNILEEFDF